MRSTRTKTRRFLQLEPLEGRALLAAGTTTLTPALVQNVQDDHMADHAQEFLSEVAQLMATRPDVQQYATAAVQAHEAAEVALHNLAEQENILVPDDLSGLYKTIALDVIRAMNTPGFDQAYLTAMAQLNFLALGNNQQLLAAPNTDAAITNYATNAVQESVNFLNAANTLLMNGQVNFASLAPPATPMGPSGLPLSTSDRNYLQNSLSENNQQIVTSQIVALLSPNQQVQLYAKKLVSDHELGVLQDYAAAASSGATLTPGITGMQVATTRAILAAVNTPNLETQYLNTMVSAHMMDLTTNQQVASATQNPNIRVLATGDAATDSLHLIGAQTLLNAANNQNNGGFPPSVSNVKERIRHSGNGTFQYSLTFDAGGYRFEHNYNLKIHRIHNQPQTGEVSGVQSIGIFLNRAQAQLARLQGGTGGQGQGNGGNQGNNNNGGQGSSGGQNTGGGMNSSQLQIRQLRRRHR